MSFSNRSERVRCLLLRLAKYDETHFMHFTDALQQEKRKDLANILIEGYNEYKNRKTERTPKCAHCKIKSRVELKDVIDKLYQERVIDESFVDRVNRSAPCARKVLWNECFYIIKKCDRAEVLSQCLKERYEQYVTSGTYVKCTCLKQRLQTGGHFNSPSLTSGSMADWSESPVDSLSPASTFRFRNVHADTISSLSSVNSSTHRKSGSVMSKRLHQTKKVDNDSHLKFYKKGRKYKKVQEIFETKRSDNSESERINQNPLVSEMSREEILHLQTETLDSTYL
ncbi:uncharacterized protein LOC134264424 [Saccostrea cucullata]|uniref:uncharacterized protein LOC134264424 n=1 Tax=Saccostrea cuccullata TaxID=36930 RepID=UPI002ED272A3